MKKTLALILSICLLVSAVPARAVSDVPSWAEEAYADLEERNLSSYRVKASGSISREDFAALLANAIRATVSSEKLNAYPAPDKSYFADTVSLSAALQAAGYGIWEGTIGSDGLRYAMAKEPLTREQAAKMVCSALDFFSDELGYPIVPSGNSATYNDADSISAWALPYTERIASYRLMVGDQEGNFCPLVQLDWPSAVVLVSRILSLLDAGVLSSIPGLALQSQLDWSDAASFGMNDFSVAQPKTGYAQGYFTIDNGDGTVSGLVVPSPQSTYDWTAQQFIYTYPETFTVERFDKAGNLVSAKALPMELPIFGAFYDSGEHFYLAFGQMNEEKSDSAEVFRIVQYDRDWNRLGAVSVNGKDSYTTEPFRSTVSRMAVSEDGSTLALYASRTRYDGHQSNITILMDTAPFRIQEVKGQQYPDNHVSHSFGQFVRFDGSQLITVDHGDAYPRSFVLQDGSRELDLLKIAGSTGNNVTNAIGSGFELSDSGCLFLGCSAPQDGSTNEPWNVFLAYTGKSGSSVTLTWLTQSDETINCARLVKVDDDTFVAMWDQGGDLHVLTLSGTGKIVGEERVLSGVPMPPTQPVVMDGGICWIQVSDEPAVKGQPFLFRLSVDE